jgi:hypothetical protein
MTDGYSYATITADRDQPVNIAVSFYLDARAHVEAFVHQDGRRAHLTIEMGDVSATIDTARPGAVTDEDAQVARRFADQAAAYAAAVEQIAAANGGPAAA